MNAASLGVVQMPSPEKPRRKRGEGRIWLVGRIWWIQYYSRGRQVRESSHSENKAVAERLLRRRLGEVAAGVLPPPGSARVKYEELRDALQSEYRTNGRKSLETRADGSQYVPGVPELDKFFEGYRAVGITPDKIREFIIKRQNEGAANSTINRSLAALRRMFNLAAHDQRLRDVPYIQMLKEPPARCGFLEHDAYLRLREALPEYLKPIVATGYYTGMRRGEILNLKWDNVNLSDAAIRLDPGTTKNDEPRVIPLYGELLEILKAQRAKRDAECPACAFVFFNGGEPVLDFRKSWESACVRAGLGTFDAPETREGFSGLLFHDLRRSGVRNMVRAGIPQRVAMQISGHKTFEVFQRYNITSERDLQDAARMLDAYLSSRNGAKTGIPGVQANRDGDANPDVTD